MPRKLAMELVTKWASLRKHTKVDLGYVADCHSFQIQEECLWENNCQFALKCKALQEL